MARLVNKVPDKSTLIFRILTDDVPVFFESTHGVTHRMRVFALDKRFVDIAFTIFDTLVIIIVHRAENVGEFTRSCLLVLYGTCLVFVLDPSVAMFEVRSHTCLIS